jgi:hypothetical protein
MEKTMRNNSKKRKAAGANPRLFFGFYRAQPAHRNMSMIRAWQKPSRGRLKHGAPHRKTAG